MPCKAKSTNNREKLINRTVSKFKNNWSSGEFFGGPVVRTLYFHCCGSSSVSDHGTKIPCKPWRVAKKETWSLEDTVEKIKRQTADRKKILATISDKELVSRPHEDSYSPIIRKQRPQSCYRRRGILPGARGSLETDLSPLETLMRWQPTWHLDFNISQRWGTGPTKLKSDPWPKEAELISVCCLYPPYCGCWLCNSENQHTGESLISLGSSCSSINWGNG